MSRVFLCYSMRDEHEAESIYDELREHGLNVWWDREIPAEKKWAQEVARALDDSDSMIVLVTPQAMASDLVHREMTQLISDEKLTHRVFPVIIQPTYAVPWYFRRLSVFDATTDRTEGLTNVVKAIRANQAEPQR